MYIPEAFAVEDHEKAFEFIRENPFGQLVSKVEGRLFISHIPFYVDEEREVLVGHLARKNPQWNEIQGQDVLVSFAGPNGYVSPTWYNSPGVPTWNYQAVHVYGTTRHITDYQRLRDIIEKLVYQFEKSTDSADILNEDNQKVLLKAIVGLEIEISEIQCKFKLSQNRSDEDQRQVIEQFKGQGLIQLAEAMEDVNKNL